MAYHVQVAAPGAGQLSYDAIADMMADIPGAARMAPGVMCSVLANGGSRWMWLPTGTPPPAGAVTVAVTGGVWVQIEGASGSVGTSGFTPNVDQNSLVVGALDRSAWQADNPTLAPPVTPIAGVSAVTGLRSLIGVNSEANCPPGGYLERPFTVPTGVTQIAIELDEVQLGYGDVATGAGAVQLYDFAGLTQIATSAFTPTAIPTMVTSGSIAVTPGTEYRVRIACNVAAQCRFLAARARVRPTTTADAFWSAFQRLEVDASNLQGNTPRGMQNPRYANQAGVCFVDMVTTAPSLRVEVFESAEYYVGAGNYQAEVFVNGSPFATLTPSQTQDVSFLTCVLPAATALPAPFHVRVGGGIQVLGDGLGLNLDRGTYLKAIYAPTGAQLVVTPNAVKYVKVYGDSKTAGSYASIPAATSYAEILREHGWRVGAIGRGGGYLFQDCGATLTVAACAPEAQRLVSDDPDMIVIAMGRNDFLGNFYTPANLVTQIGNLADAIHAASPRCIVAIAPWSHETTENAVGGVSWDTERQSYAALVTSRSPWCILADLGGTWTSAQAATYTADTVHPDDAGYSRVSRTIESAAIVQSYDYAFKPSDLSPTAWWESDVGLAGGAMGAVTSAGSGGPPVVTFTGSPTLAAQLIVEVRTPGALGVATFDASLDGGRSWPYRNVVTGAAVLLAAFGLTVHFGVGPYFVDNTYFGNSAAGAWTDMLGSGDSIAPTGVLWTPPAIVGTPPGPGVAFPNLRFGGAAKMLLTGLNIPQPWTVVVVGQMDANVLLQPIIGEDGAASGPYLYADGANTVAANFNGSQISNASTDITKLHCYAILANGAASNFYIDGVPNTGTLGAGNLTAQALGWDSVQAAFLTGNIMAYGILPTGITADQALCVASRMRAKYGTP